MKHTINDTRTSTVEINVSNDIWIFGTTANLTASGSSIIHESAASENNKIIFRGVASGQFADSGIHLEGIKTHLDITRDGIINVISDGVLVDGNRAEIFNAGRIFAVGGTGVTLHGDHTQFTNAGYIQGSGSTGLYVTGDTTTIVNQKSGVIKGIYDSIRIDVGTGDDSGSIINHGLLVGDVWGSEGKFHLINDGKVQGRVLMGEGDGTVDNRGGHITGIVDGSTGSDTLITDDAKVKLQEYAGQGVLDTVKSTVSYTLSNEVERLVLLGSKDINGKGNEGANQLIGNSGDNKLTGLGGADTFVFANGNGHDRVTDFSIADDTIDLSKFKGIYNFNDLSHHHVKFQNGDMVIFAGHDEIRVDDIAKADLKHMNFEF